MAGQSKKAPEHLAAQQQRVRSTVSSHTLLSIISAAAGLIKQKTLFLLNNLSSPAVQKKKNPSKKHFFSWMNYYISNPYLPNHQIQTTYYSNTLRTQAHKFPWALSQILPVISHISSNLNSP